jgi:hypothetical protein
VDPQKTGQLVGQILVLLLMAAASAYAWNRAGKHEERSRRLAGYGVACGLLVLPLLGVLTFAHGSGGRAVFIAAGVGGIIAGVMAVTLAIRARAARKAANATGGAMGPAAGVLGVICVLFGATAIAFPFIVNPDEGGPPSSPNSRTMWVHRIDPPGLEITLPSDRWKKYDRAGEAAMFASRVPQMMTSVRDVKPAPDLTAFERVVTDVKRLFADNGTSIIEEKREPNAHGYDHLRILGEEKTPSGRVVVGMSVTWWNKSHAVIMIFEGQYQMKSDAAQDQESQAFRAAAATILNSVK